MCAWNCWQSIRRNRDITVGLACSLIAPQIDPDCWMTPTTSRDECPKSGWWHLRECRENAGHLPLWQTKRYETLLKYWRCRPNPLIKLSRDRPDLHRSCQPGRISTTELVPRLVRNASFTIRVLRSTVTAVLASIPTKRNRDNAVMAASREITFFIIVRCSIIPDPISFGFTDTISPVTCSHRARATDIER